MESSEVTFNSSVVSFFNNFVNFNGVATRAEFWWAQLFIWIVEIFGLFLFWTGAMFSFTMNGGSAGVLFYLGLFVMVAASIVFIIPQVSLTVRRLHDAGLSGVWALLLLVPAVSFIFYLIIGFLPSVVEGNQFREVVVVEDVLV